MNISSISAGSNSHLPIQSNGEIKMLEKQKEQLVKQIQTTKESDMDPKSKQETIKLLQEQVQQIETQISQKRSEKLADSVKSNSNDSNSKSQKQSSIKETGDDSLSGMSDLLKANAALSKAKLMSSTKESLNGRGNILKEEIKLDEGRGIDPKAKKAELADGKLRIQTLNKDMGSELKESQEKVNDASEATGDDDTEAASNNTVVEDGTVQVSSVNKNEQNEEPANNHQNEDLANNTQQENDSLTWLLENKDKYKKVDVLF